MHSGTSLPLEGPSMKLLLKSSVKHLMVKQALRTICDSCPCLGKLLEPMMKSLLFQRDRLKKLLIPQTSAQSILRMSLNWHIPTIRSTKLKKKIFLVL